MQEEKPQVPPPEEYPDDLVLWSVWTKRKNIEAMKSKIKGALIYSTQPFPAPVEELSKGKYAHKLAQLFEYAFLNAAKQEKVAPWMTVTTPQK